METRPDSTLPELSANQVIEEPAISLEPIQSIWRTLVRCNPFYLFSALLLLYGVYRASIDPAFLSTEARQVIFNFSSIEIYGLMLVGTVTFLARRRIFYDATLLYFIENVLVLIPFILISQAVFLDSALARNLSLIGCVLAGVKFGAFKGFFGGLNLPRRLLLVGALIVVVNTAMPLVFRKGLDADNELWALRSQYCWFLLLPLLAMAGHVLNPLRPGHGDSAADEHRKQWIPLATFLLWITGTAAHLYSVGYVDDQKFELARFTVLAWAIAWLLCAKITLVMSRFTPAAPEIMLSLPIAISLIGLGRPEVMVVINVLNTTIFAVLCWRWKALRLPAVLGGISLLCALLSVPARWITPIVSDYDKSKLIFGLVAAAFIIKAICTRTARWGLIGAFVLAMFLGVLGAKLRFSPHYALHIAPVFLLVHSLFWIGPRERGEKVLVVLAATLLTLNSLAMGNSGMPLKLLPYIAGVPLLLLAFLFRRAVVPIIAAIASMIVIPLSYATSGLKAAPVGMIALGASFVLFGLGTAFAIWKRRFPDHATGIKETSV